MFFLIKINICKRKYQIKLVINAKRVTRIVSKILKYYVYVYMYTYIYRRICITFT